MPMLEVFFDYACPYCLRGHKYLFELLPQYPQIEIICVRAKRIRTRSATVCIVICVHAGCTLHWNMTLILRSITARCIVPHWKTMQTLRICTLCRNLQTVCWITGNFTLHYSAERIETNSWKIIGLRGKPTVFRLYHLIA